jgi:hypothetical protein
MAVTNSISNWDFNNFHVQVDLRAGEFINAFSVLLAAGPPRLRLAGDSSQVTGTPIRGEESVVAYPIGVVENYAMSQNKQLQRLFEIGSKRSYFIPGRNVVSFQLARTVFHGPNLLRALYAYAPAAKINPSVVDLLTSRAGRATAQFPQIRNNPGFADAFLNLDSDVFDQPFGFLVIMRDSENKSYASFYLEDCHLQGHQMSINSSSTLVAEAVSGQCDQVIPIDVGAVPRSTVAQNAFDDRAA